MLFTKGICEVKIYDGDKLIAESPVRYSNEFMPIKIPQNDIDVILDILTHYEIRQDETDGKRYLFADGVKICEAFSKNNP